MPAQSTATPSPSPSRCTARIEQDLASNGSSLSAARGLLLELLRRRVNAGIPLTGGFTPEEQSVCQRLRCFRTAGNPVSAPLLAWCQLSSRRFSDGRLPDGPVARRSGAAGKEEADTVWPEQDEMLAGVGNWTESEGAEHVDHGPAGIAIELGVEESSTSPLVRAGPAA